MSVRRLQAPRFGLQAVGFRSVCLVVMAVAPLSSCIRPTDSYDVRVHGAGTDLSDVLAEPEPMGGRIEYARYRLWGHNLGHGITQFFGDAPRADGTTFVFGNAEFGYPADAGYDRMSTLVMAGPPLVGDEDAACLTRIDARGYLGISEYVDVGDRVTLTAEGFHVELPRDPAVHPRPAGESWYVGYGGKLGPAVTGHGLLASTWSPGALLAVSFPGTVQEPEATIGAIPYPSDGDFRLPEAVSGLTLDGEEVRAPHHGYDSAGVWDGVTEDAVRFPGPWSAPVTLAWSPSDAGEPLTVTVRFLGLGQEGACDCATDCGEGFVCNEEEGFCESADGSGWNVLGEVTCTVADDGEWSLEPARLDGLQAVYPADDPNEVGGVVLMVSRVVEGTLQVDDVLTANGRRIPVTPVRTRAIDTVVTRLEQP